MRQTLITKICNFILALLGFAVSNSCEDPNMKCMYGTPTMDFEVSGKVVDKDSSPIAGIRVSCNVFNEAGIVTALTATDGSFNVSGTGFSPVLKFEDIDGPLNGGDFADKTEDIKVEQIKKGDGAWYWGKYEAKGVVIELEEKK